MSDPFRRRPSEAWWLYFALLLALTALSVVSSHSVMGLASGFINGFGLVGLWGYIRQEAVGPKVFWVFYFFLSVLLSVAALAVNVTDSMPVGFVVFSLALSLPLYYALWHYAFRSQSAWRESDA